MKDPATIPPRKTARRTGTEVHIPILPPLRAELDQLSHDSEYVLPAIAEAYERDNSAITKQIKKIFEKAKVTTAKKTQLDTAQTIVAKGAHSFRYSFVTLARIAGIPDGTIQRITGHETVEMVDKYDSSFNKEEVGKLANSLTLGTLEAPKPARDPLPKWVLELIAKQDADNWEEIKTELMKEAAQ